jgi:hypothetical protein
MLARDPIFVVTQSGPIGLWPEGNDVYRIRKLRREGCDVNGCFDEYPEALQCPLRILQPLAER